MTIFYDSWNPECLEMKFLAHSTESKQDLQHSSNVKWQEIILLAFFKRVIFNLLLIQYMTLYCCHILITGNDDFYYSHYVEVDLKLNFRYISLKDYFHYSSYVKGHGIILLTQFVEKNG